MRSLTLAAGLITLLASSAAATGATITLGGPLSQRCYESAVAHDDRGSAIDACNRSLSEEALTRPDRAATYVNRGVLLMDLGRSVDADADFDAALALDRSAPDPWLNKGFLRLRGGQGRDALPLLDEGIKRQPRREALAYFARGLAYEDVGDFSAAYADLRRARELEPSWRLPGEYLARYQVKHGR